MTAKTKLENLHERPSAWVSNEGHGIVISSRIRLARNLKDAPFPGWAGDDDSQKVWSKLSEAIPQTELMKDAVTVLMSELSDLDKQVLFERNLISNEHTEASAGAGLVLQLDERCAIMVNEEDHLRLQAIRPNLDLMAAWEHINDVDNQIEQLVSFAYDEKLGYLTACPSNVGTGMRASVMVHVPGLVLLNEMNLIVKGLSKIGLAVRGIGGEGSEASGNIFQISNQITLGEKEEKIIEELNEIVLEIVKHEENARKRLHQSKENLLLDHIGRAEGILSRAHVLASKEALDLLSGLRLGVNLGIIKHIDRSTVDELLLKTRPGHLQKLEKKVLSTSERDIARARMIRETLTVDA